MNRLRERPPLGHGKEAGAQVSWGWGTDEGWEELY